LEVKPGYKLTEAGVIPEEWESVPAAALVEPTAPICYGVVQVGQDTNGGVPIVAIKYVKEVATAPLHRTSTAVEQLYSRSRVRGGDVLISVKGTIGRVGIVPNGFTGNISRELARLRPKQEYSEEYIGHQLESDLTQARIARAVVGTTRLEFSIAALRRFELPVPRSIAEQRAIAAALSDVDALLVALNRAIEKKRGLKQAAKQQLLTGRSRLPDFAQQGEFRSSAAGRIPADWRTSTVGDLASIKTGNRNTQDRVADGLYPFFVRSQTVETIDSYSFDGEAVLTAGDGVGTGKVFHYIRGRFDVHQRVYRMSDFHPDLYGYYFFLYFSSHFYGRIMSMTAKSSVDSVRLEMIAGMAVPLPSVAEQKAISEVLMDMDAALTALEKRREKIIILKQGMMQELLTGRTRLV
jgi:type I restriction enzyme S subunit